MNELEGYLKRVQQVDHEEELLKLSWEILEAILHNIHWRITGPQYEHYARALTFLKAQGCLGPQAYDLLCRQVAQLLRERGADSLYRYGYGYGYDYSYGNPGEFPHDYVGIGGTLI
jgi:hypothetical protein